MKDALDIGMIVATRHSRDALLLEFELKYGLSAQGVGVSDELYSVDGESVPVMVFDSNLRKLNESVIEKILARIFRDGLVDTFNEFVILVCEDGKAGGVLPVININDPSDQSEFSYRDIGTLEEVEMATDDFLWVASKEKIYQIN